MGSTRTGPAMRHPRSHAENVGPARTSPGTDPKGPLPQNEIVRVRSHTQGLVSERRASTTCEAQRATSCLLRFSSKAARSSAGDARATE
jgi:hypothetical protein